MATFSRSARDLLFNVLPSQFELSGLHSVVTRSCGGYRRPRPPPLRDLDAASAFWLPRSREYDSRFRLDSLSRWLERSPEVVFPEEAGGLAVLPPEEDGFFAEVSSQPPLPLDFCH